jgi:redox-sensitive bicupin YhaK (pirin superfamily)
MIEVRRADERGHAQHGWLESYHTFSFADYYDARFMGFRALRVINEDRVQPGQGFGTHPHRDMEIVTYVLDGALEHKDSPGTGVTHSEFNHSHTELVHFLQIWILPEEQGVHPSYEQRAFPESERMDRLRLVASRDARDGSVKVHQDVELYAALLSARATLEYTFRAGRHGWLQIARGRASVNEHALSAGDGVEFSNEPVVKVSARGRAEILLFDLA